MAAVSEEQVKNLFRNVKATVQDNGFFLITTLDGNKSVRVRPTQVHQVIELPHKGYIEKHPELKKYGFK